MWNWVEPAFQYGSGPLIAAVAVITTQILANRREERRIDGERSERALDREHQASTALQERWRDDRRAAYRSLLNAFDESIKFGAEAVTLLGTGDVPVTGPGGSLERFETVVSTILPRVVSDTSLVASDATTTAAKALHESLRVFVTLVSTEQHKQARDALHTCRHLREEFLAGARTDLGTP